MLKSAAEMATAARLARQHADELAREERESEAWEREAAASLEAAHRVFEGQALAAARQGKLEFAFTGSGLSLERLEEQGFVTENLVRRESFMEHLSGLIATNSEQLPFVCERIVRAFPNLVCINGDELLHRNPLISLFETLWRRGDLQVPEHQALPLLLNRIQNTLTSADVGQLRPKLSEALRLFIDLKRAQSKHERLRWESRMIPSEASSAVYVSWISAHDWEGQECTFSASRLKWLVMTWPKLAAIIGASIEEAAFRGQSRLTQYVWRTGGSWRICDRWPPDARIEDEELEDEDFGVEDFDFTKDHSWGAETFCHPALAAEELTHAGYAVTVEPVAVSKNPKSSPAESYLATRAGQAYALKINWP